MAVALIVFGPKRLPEISRKAGNILREIRDTASDLRKGIENEYDGAVESFGEVRRTMGPTLQPSTEPSASTHTGPEE